MVESKKRKRIIAFAVVDTKKPHTPDSVFPNNWFSTHDDGTLVLYPMFAGNMLELHNRDGQPCLIMSLAAYHSLTEEQVEFLESKMTLITPDLECIEQNGGGSARCMIAEIF